MKIKKKLENIKVNYYLKDKGYIIVGKDNSKTINFKKKVSKATLILNENLKNLTRDDQAGFSFTAYDNYEKFNKVVKTLTQKKSFDKIIKSKNLYFVFYKNTKQYYKLSWSESLYKLNFLLLQHLKLFKIKNMIIIKQIKN